jgi:hypothetical protein
LSIEDGNERCKLFLIKEAFLLSGGDKWKQFIQYIIVPIPCTVMQETLDDWEVVIITPIYCSVTSFHNINPQFTCIGCRIVLFGHLMWAVVGLIGNRRCCDGWLMVL